MMSIQGPLREARRLRLRMQLDNRLRLEVLAALSRTFRENREQVSNDLLRSIVFAVPEELPGEGEASKMARSVTRTVPPQPGAAKKRQVPPQPGKAKRVPPQPGKARRVPPQPGKARRVPPQPGKARRVRPQPGGVKGGKKSAKKSGKKR